VFFYNNNTSIFFYANKNQHIPTEHFYIQHTLHQRDLVNDSSCIVGIYSYLEALQIKWLLQREYMRA